MTETMSHVEAQIIFDRMERCLGDRKIDCLASEILRIIAQEKEKKS